MFNNSNLKHLKIGRSGEDIACEYLVRKGFRILERNFRRTYGEIDVIARERTGTLVFVEVKTLRHGSDANISPEDNMTKDKIRKLKKICKAYANQKKELVKEKAGWRIDLVAIELKRSGEYEVRHYENI